MTKDRPVFHYKLGWSTDYGLLFRREFSQETGTVAVLEVARRTGRALLVGKGGSGKTTIAHRLIEAASHNGNLTCLIDLKLWSARLEREWERLEQKAMLRADLLLSEFGHPSLSLSKIDQLRPELTKFIVIDGLNEVRSSIAEQILGTADRLASTIIDLSVIVTDRLVRREAALDHWSLAMVLPLEEHATRGAIEEALGPAIDWATVTVGQKRLLENPFFLDKAIQEKTVSSNVAEAISRYLSIHTGLSEAELSTVAFAAFAMYQAAGARSFDVDEMSRITGSKTFEQLVQSGVVEREHRIAYFSHHLFHDYLSAKYVAGAPERWNYDALNTISFGASSFDAIALVLQLLGGSSADNFVRRVYDWNPYAAAYALSDLEGDHVSNDLKFVIAAMLAQRLDDIFSKTAERSADALSLLGTFASKRLLKAPGQIQTLLTEVNGEHEWFSEWKGLATQPNRAKPENRTLEFLTSDDPILGWTAANVIRRQNPDNAQFAAIRNLAENSEAAPVRWRSVHALGAFAGNENEQVLLRRLTEDTDEWVAYGALRSLMEMAARSREMRVTVMADLLGHVELLYSRRRLREEFARAVFAQVDDPRSWLDAVGVIIQEFAYRAEDRAAFESWVQLGDRLKHFLGTEHGG